MSIHKKDATPGPGQDNGAGVQARNQSSECTALAPPEGLPSWAWELVARPDGARWAIDERDASGTIIGTAYRAEDGRKTCRPGGKRGLIVAWPLPTYAGTSAAEPIFVCEGASDAAILLALGMEAVGVPMAGQCGEMLADLLAGLHVCIVADADDAGRRGADKVAEALATRSASVKIIEPPERAKDARAAVIAGAGREDFLAAAREACPAGVKRTQAGSAAARGPRVEQPHISTAELIVRLAEERFRLGCTETGEAFAVRRGGPNVAIMLRGSRDALRAALAKEFRAAHGKTAGAAALTDAVNVLQGIAQDAEPEPVSLRVAEHEGGIVLDLGRSDGRAVMIRAGGWDLVDRSPVLFRRTALTAALPDPVRGGSLDELQDLLNIEADSWPLLVGYLVAALFPLIAHPIMLLGGMEGTGKTTAAAFMAGLFDPCTADNHNVPRDPEAWAMAANGSWGVVVDNVSAIPEWWSDALCKAVTGAGWIRRAHYENSALSVLTFRRVVILTSIDAGAMRGDLGSRLLIVDLEPITPERRRDETILRAEYAVRRPAIMGALLDLAAAVLRERPTVAVRSRPRMADFVRILAAMDLVLGTGSVDLYLAQRGRIAEDVVAGDAVGEAVASLVSEIGDWRGTVGELLERLNPEGQKRPEHWPRNARALAGRLKRLIPALATVGVLVVSPAKTDKTRRWAISRQGTQPTARTALPPETAAGEGDRFGPAGTGKETSGQFVPGDGVSEHLAAGPGVGDSGLSGDMGGRTPRSTSQRPCPACGGIDHWRYRTDPAQRRVCRACTSPSHPAWAVDADLASEAAE